MSTDTAFVNRVMQKLQLLLQSYHQLQKEQEKLVKQVTELEQQKNASEAKLEAMELQLAALKTARPVMSDDDKKQLEKRLQQYIKEIDRCIALLSE